MSRLLKSWSWHLPEEKAVPSHSRVFAQLIVFGTGVCRNTGRDIWRVFIPVLARHILHYVNNVILILNLILQISLIYIRTYIWRVSFASLADTPQSTPLRDSDPEPACNKNETRAKPTRVSDTDDYWLWSTTYNLLSSYEYQDSNGFNTGTLSCLKFHDLCYFAVWFKFIDIKPVRKLFMSDSS